MVKGIWIYEVPLERQESYLKATRDAIKPFWESHGCLSYEVYRDYQTPTRFVKIQTYPDVETMERDGRLVFVDKDPGALRVVELFRSFTSTMEKRLCEPFCT